MQKLWLPEDNPYRSTRMKDHFNGQMETRSRPQTVSAEEQLKKAMQYQAWLNEGNKEGSIGDPSKDHGVLWKAT